MNIAGSSGLMCPYHDYRSHHDHYQYPVQLFVALLAQGNIAVTTPCSLDCPVRQPDTLTAGINCCLPDVPRLLSRVMHSKQFKHNCSKCYRRHRLTAVLDTNNPLICVGLRLDSSCWRSLRACPSRANISSLGLGQHGVRHLHMMSRTERRSSRLYRVYSHRAGGQWSVE